MFGALKQIRQNQRGASLVEFSLIVPLLFVLTFGVIDMGYVLFQYNAAVKATQVGAQYAATHDPAVQNLNDCGVADYSDKAGTDCASVTGYSNWSVTCPSGANCNAAVMASIVTEMQAVFPNLEAENVTVTFSGEPGLGYIGRGRPVPVITVEIEDLNYSYIAIGGLVAAIADNVNLGTTKSITSARTSIIAEDLREGT